MSRLTRFAPPANQDDLSNYPDVNEAFLDRWSDNLGRFTEQTLQNDPWSSTNQPPLTDYYNPLTTDTPAASAPILWTAFPNRIKVLYPSVGQRKQWQYADEGPPSGYYPAGPRGWQDEYCEWSVTRNKNGKVTSVDFTCENREYWYTLWTYSPDRVLEIYRELVSSSVTLDDLCAHDSNTGDVIIDPETNQPAYNGLNQWNSSTTDGAVHLISAPNSLSAEIFLAGQATVLREDAQGQPITDRNALIGCSRYGTANRNSDPSIGAFVNNVVRGGNQVSLTDPVGLYIQTPNFMRFQLPLEAPPEKSPADYWKVIRGRLQGQGEKLDYILHARFEVPQEDGFGVGDITIDGFNIDYGAQITDTFQIGLAGTPVPHTGPPAAQYRCAGSPTSPLPRAFLMCYSDMVPVAQQSSLNLRLEQGANAQDITLAVSEGERNSILKVTPAGGVTVAITDYQGAGDTAFYTLTVTVASDAPVGERGIQVINHDGAHGPAAFGMFEVVPAGSLAKRSSGPSATPLSVRAETLRNHLRPR